MYEKDPRNRTLLCVEVGDIVRFKNGKVAWEVYAILNRNGKQHIKLRRWRTSGLGRRKRRVCRTVVQGTPEYYGLRIVKPHANS